MYWLRPTLQTTLKVIARAIVMAAENLDKTKVCFDGYIYFRWIVSHALIGVSIFIQRQLTSICSVCVVSILRLVAYSRTNPSDITCMFAHLA